LNSLNINQVNELLAEGFVLSSILKTGAKFGYQPVIATARSRYLMGIFKEKLRPLTIGEAGKAQFFITQDGSSFDVGRSVTRFFKKNMGLHLTTTTFRSMMETLSADHEQVFIYTL
jgi:hypothetical protein